MVWFLSREDPLEKDMATHSSILAWRIPWAEKPGWLQFIGSQRVGYDWSNLAHTHMNTHRPHLRMRHYRSSVWNSYLWFLWFSPKSPPASLHTFPKCSHTLDCREYIKIRLEYTSVCSLKLNYEAEVSFPSTRVPSPPLQSEVSL